MKSFSLTVIIIITFFSGIAQSSPKPLDIKNIFEPIQIGPGLGDTLNAKQLTALLKWIDETDWQPGMKILNANGSGAVITKDTLDIFIGTDIKIFRCRKIKYKLVNGILQKFN